MTIAVDSDRAEIGGATDGGAAAGSRPGGADPSPAAFFWRWRPPWPWTLPSKGRCREALAGWFGRQVETEAAARSGFHLIPIGLMVGIAFVDGAGLRLPWLLSAALAASIPVLAWRLALHPVGRTLAFFVGFVLCGTLLATLEIERTRTTIFSGEATVRITGTVSARERDDRGRFRYLIDVQRTERPVLSRPPETVRIVVGSRHTPIPIGGTYQGLVRLRPPAGPAMPGAYDFAFAPFFDGVGAYGFSLGAPVPAAEAASARGPSARFIPAVRQTLATIRLGMTERIREAIGGPESAIAAALITGERAGLPKDAEEWLRGTGLAHVLSISGLHMAIVAGFAMMLVRSLLSLFPAIALRFAAKKIAAAVALVIAAFYLGLSGGNFATQRSFVMLAIMLAAIMLDRPALTLRNVSIAAIVIIVLTPHAVLTASFQMSFSATVALIGGYAVLTRNRSSRSSASHGTVRKLMVALLAIALTSLLAGSATGPYSVYHFHRLALFGFVANVLTMPFFSLWIMPLALIGCLVMPFGLEALPLKAMGLGIEAVLTIAKFVYERLPDQSAGTTTIVGLVLMTAAILAGSCCASRLRWAAVPLLAAGLLAAPDRSAKPSLLVFEDGKEVATIDGRDGGPASLVFLRERPNGFVAEQWERSLGLEAPGPDPGPNSGQGADQDDGGTAKTPRNARRRIVARCDESVCRFTTPDGLRVAYTEDHQKTGAVCDGADVAIVARAIRLEQCRSGAAMVTLRSLRRSGSLAIRRDPETGRPVIERSIADRPEAWNVHRLAPWPEFWKKPEAPSAISDAAPAAARPGLPPTLEPDSRQATTR